MNVSVAISCAIAFAIGLAFAALLSRSRTAALAERTSALQRDLDLARATVERMTGELNTMGQTRASLEERLTGERRAAEEKLKLVIDASEHLKAQFKVMAAAALENNSANFLQLATTALQTSQAKAVGDMSQKEEAVRNLVEPIAKSLEGMNQQIQDLEKARSQAYGTLTTQVHSLLETQKALQTETGNLVKALREPQARGRWGELQLHRVLELAGMLEYCDFKEQLSFNDEERRFRPDVIVDLPGGKQVIVDAKVPLTAYLAALEAPDDETRNARLKDHARQVRQHIESLGNKTYWAHLGCTPEFVVLFLPGEVFFRAAMDADPELIEYGVSQKVIVASPTTLIALLKAVAYGWNQKSLAESARNISEAGKTLYDRLCTMTGYLEDLGRKLGGAVKSYNEMLSSVERRVLPVARKFPELDRSLSADSLPEIPQLERTPRELQSQDWHEIKPEELPFLPEKAESANA